MTSYKHSLLIQEVTNYSLKNLQLHGVLAVSQGPVINFVPIKIFRDEVCKILSPNYKQVEAQIIYKNLINNSDQEFKCPYEKVIILNRKIKWDESEQHFFDII